MVWDLTRHFDGVAVSSNYGGNKYCLITITAAITLIQGLTVAALKTSIFIHIPLLNHPN